jgi:hypothetical protein
MGLKADHMTIKKIQLSGMIARLGAKTDIT